MSPEDVQACEEKYNKSKMVHSILRHVAETTSSHDLTELYEVYYLNALLFVLTALLVSWLATLPVVRTRV